MCVCLNIKQLDNTLLSINNTSENTNFIQNIFLKVIPSLWSWVCLFFNCRDRKSNKEMPERTGIADLNVEIKKRRWKYLDHLLRRDTEIFEMDSTR